MFSTRPRSNLSADTNRSRSPNFWYDCPWENIQNGIVDGVTVFDDFAVGGFLASTVTTQAVQGFGWKAFASNSGDITHSSTEGGGLVLEGNTSNEGSSLAQIVLPFKIIRTYGDFWFECRVKTGTITNDDMGWFAGLVEQQTLSATIPIAAAGTLADANFVGFHALEGDGDQCDTVYKANGVTQVSAADQLHTALVADTYTKLGMRYRQSDFSFEFFQNNKKLATSYTIPSAAGTDFPNDVFMGICFAVLGGSGASNDVLTIDWVRAAQIYTK